MQLTQPTPLGLLVPGHTIVRKISIAVSPGLFGIWLITDLKLLPLPGHAVWAAAVNPSPPGLQTKRIPIYCLPRPLRFPREVENGEVVRSENRGR